MKRPDDEWPEDISVFEDLDPEPESGRRAAGALEVIVGMALLVGVLAWVFGTWWHDSNSSSHYQQGQRAELQHRWDEALADYSAASGYRDADSRAADAARKISERDNQYQIAAARVQDNSASSALVALQAARAVQAIQPSYKDTDSLAARAEDTLYTAALSNTVVMRQNASPPGLYYRGSGGWLYLQGSDRWSSVMSTVSGDHIAYDVAGPGWTPPGPGVTPTPAVYFTPAGSPDKAGRRLMVAILSSDHRQARFQSLGLGPVDYNFYICGDSGVWGVRYTPSQTQGTIAQTFFSDTALAYQAHGRPGVSPVPTVGINGVVADLGHRGEHALLLGYGQRVNDKPDAQVYLAGPDGSNPRAVFSTTGTLVSARLSPDERYALVVAAEEPQDGLPRGKLVVTASLLDLQRGGGAGSQLSQTTVDQISMYSDAPLNLDGSFTMGGTFLQSGLFKNDLLLAWVEGDSVRLSLIDPAKPLSPLVGTSLDFTHTSYIPIYEQPGGAAVTVYNQDVQPRLAPGRPPVGEVRVLSAAGPPQDPVATVIPESYKLDFQPKSSIDNEGYEYLSDPMLYGSDVIYGVMSTNSRQDVFTVYRVPADGSSRRSEIFSATISQAGEGQLPVSWVLGAGALAYTDLDGVLHVKPYDSDADATLENGIGKIVQLDDNGPYDTLR